MHYAFAVRFRWVLHDQQKRLMTTAELLAFQGFPKGRFSLPDGVHERDLRQMAGNAFSVPVIGKIEIALLKLVGLVS